MGRSARSSILRQQGYLSLIIGLVILTGVFALLAVAVTALVNHQRDRDQPGRSAPERA